MKPATVEQDELRPVALASIQAGETVLDLGSGGEFEPA